MSYLYRYDSKISLRPPILTRGPVRVKNGQIQKPLAPRDFSPQKPPRYRFSARFLKIEILLIYTGCTQCATPKLPKKVLHIGDIVAHWGHCPEKIEMKFLIKNRLFLSILKNKGQFMVNNGRIF